MAEQLRVLGAFATEEEMKPIVAELRARGYQKEDIKLVANHPLRGFLNKQTHTYNQMDVDPTDDNILSPEETHGLYIHAYDPEIVKSEQEQYDKGNIWDRLRDFFSYGDYLKPDEEMLIKDYQDDVSAGHIVVILNDEHVAPEKRYHRA